MKLNLKNIIFIALLLVVIVGCEEKYKPVNYKKMEESENALLAKFYEGEVWDSLYTLAVDTIDERSKNGLMYLEIEKGSGDSISLGQQVGIRYTYYGILYDLEDVPNIYYIEDNKFDEEPYTYTVGTVPTTLYTGVDLGVRKMRNHGKSILIMPSAISTNNNYITIVAEIDVEFIELD